MSVPTSAQADEVRERLWAALGRVRDETTPLRDRDVLCEMRELLSGVRGEE